jgi:membrane-associated phospholipid phosphatase
MRLTKIERFILYPLIGVLLVVFAFYDLPIMQSLFNQSNVFGRMGELGGEIPTQLLGVVAGVWLFRFRDKSTKKRSILWGILFVVIALFFAGYGGGQIYSYLKKSDYTNYSWHPNIGIAFPVAAVYLLVGGFLGYKIKVSSPKEAVVFAWFFVILYLSTLLVMNLGKFLWARPRWRYLVVAYPSDPQDYFVPWYHLSCNGGFSDKLASFPSGHTMNALCWIALAGASSFIDGLKGKEWIVRVCAYVWAALVGLSRTIMGAHFPSDTTAGFFLELLLFDLLGTFFFPWFHQKVLAHLQKRQNAPKTVPEA